MKLGVALLGATLLTACVSSTAWRKDGLDGETLLRLEAADWGVPMGQWQWPEHAKSMGVPVDARPIGLREIKCRGDQGKPRLYDCSYLVDWGRGGKVEGTYKQTYVLVGRDEHGEWSNDWVVVT